MKNKYIILLLLTVISSFSPHAYCESTQQHAADVFFDAYINKDYECMYEMLSEEGMKTEFDNFFAFDSFMFNRTQEIVTYNGPFVADYIIQYICSNGTAKYTFFMKMDNNQVSLFGIIPFYDSAENILQMLMDGDNEAVYNAFSEEAKLSFSQKHFINAIEKYELTKGRRDDTPTLRRVGVSSCRDRQGGKVKARVRIHCPKEAIAKDHRNSR